MHNGHHSWGPPSLMDILLRIENRLGGLEHGQKTGLANDGEIFGHLRQLNHRVSTVEAHPNLTRHFIRQPTAPAAASPTSRTDRINVWEERIKAVGEAAKVIGFLMASLAWAATALGIAVKPELVQYVLAFAP